VDMFVVYQGYQFWCYQEYTKLIYQIMVNEPKLV
jgi:hypothetical protein